MDYRMDLGAWNSVFVVPSDIVDKHLKLAGAAQLKVILWFLRHAGENYSTEDIARALSMQEADVRDSLLYWSETGVIYVSEGKITPAKSEINESFSSDETVKTQSASEEVTQKTENVEPEKQTKSSRALSRPEKPDIRYLTKRMSEDEGIVYLMQAADEIFGRPTNNNDKATLLMIHETDGLPVEVIIMLLQYAAEIGKCNIRYIEKIAISWADDEVNTLERAEKRIQQLTSGRNAAGIVQNIIGLEKHSPTEKETYYADRWINQWKFTSEMIRRAYEICVDTKSKYIPKYVDSVLGRWFSSGITTPEQADMDQSKGKKKAQNKTYEATYDISEFESSSIIDEEG